MIWLFRSSLWVIRTDTVHSLLVYANLSWAVFGVFSLVYVNLLAFHRRPINHRHAIFPPRWVWVWMRGFLKRLVLHAAWFYSNYFLLILIDQLWFWQSYPSLSLTVNMFWCYLSFKLILGWCGFTEQVLKVLVRLTCAVHKLFRSQQSLWLLCFLRALNRFQRSYTVYSIFLNFRIVVCLYLNIKAIYQLLPTCLCRRR